MHIVYWRWRRGKLRSNWIINCHSLGIMLSTENRTESLLKGSRRFCNRLHI